MLDLKFIRENPEVVKKAVELKNITLNVDELLRCDQTLSELKTKIEALQAQRNKNAKQVSTVPAEERGALIQKGKELAQQIEELKPSLTKAEEELQNFLWQVPNIPAADVPVGLDETGNVEVKKWGELPKKDFPLLGHVDILHKRNWANLEQTTKVCGSRTYSLKNELVLLEFALLQFALEKMHQKKFQLITVPSLVREFALYGTGHFPQGREQVYHLQNDDLYLAGTSEVPINSLHSGELLEEASLPILYAGYSVCFRREAGSAGKDVRGLIRVHQFVKVEQFVICQNDPEVSAYWHKNLLSISEEIMQELEIPYRVVECCTGDMGLGKVKMFDIEGWVPSEGKYRETHSCSSLHDWQARRANLRYRDSKGDVKFCHTLNNTALASPRILVPFLENHQQKDGAIAIPKALRPYLGNKTSL